MGQKQNAPAKLDGESYPQETPYDITMLQSCLENSKITKIESTSDYAQDFQYLLKSQQSSHVVFGVKFAGDGKQLSGPVQIYLISNSKQNKTNYLCFEGELLKGKRNAFGVEYYKKDIFYQGFFKNNKYHGWGITSTYEGEWASGSKCGYGKYKSKYPLEGKKMNFTYEGYWKSDKFDGLGAKNITLAESEAFVAQNYIRSTKQSIDEQYIGEWQQGVKMGCGKLIKYFKNTNGAYRQIYEGEFSRNMYHGRGKLLKDKEQKQQGKFQLGIFIGPL